jgi:hypothetical protein
MLGKDNRYLKLVEGPVVKPENSQIEIIPQSRVVELSGKKWGWVWNRPSSVLVRNRNVEQRYPILDLTRVLQLLLFGISLVMIVAGVMIMLGKRKGE